MAISKLDKVKILQEGYIDVDPNDQLKISQIQECGRYMLDLKPESDKSWIIRKNPNFATNKAIMWASVFSATFALISLIIVIFNNIYINVDAFERQKRLESELKELKLKLKD